mgnify:CR=1 FL=1|jgi:hypothetical protein|nr:MAG TPA: Protein of unknown function (DUF3102) [Caudoviricetes sp.]
MENLIRQPDDNDCMTWSLDDIEHSILNSSVSMARCMLEIGKGLKAICDGKKYAERGFGSFKEYMEDSTAHRYPFSYTQARKHIRVYERYGNRLAELNCAKVEVLDILRDIPEEDFSELNSSGALEDMTKKEAEEYKAKLAAANEQITLLEAERDEAVEKAESMEESFKQELEVSARLREEADEASHRTIDVAVAEPSEERISEIRSEIEKELAKDSEAKIKALEKEKNDCIEQIKAIEAKHDSEKQSLIDKLGADGEAANAKIKELERKLQSAAKPADAELIEFKFYFEETQSNLKKFIGALNKVSDADKQSKFRLAAITFVEAILSDLKQGK